MGAFVLTRREPEGDACIERLPARWDAGIGTQGDEKVMKVPGVEALREALAALSLDTRGHKAQLKKRLRTASKRADGGHEASNGSTATVQAARQKQTPSNSKRQRPEGQEFDSYLVVDFEATCQRYEPKHGQFFGYPNEIIEFPVVLLQWRRKKVVKRSTTQNSDTSDADSSVSSDSTTSDETSSNSEDEALIDLDDENKPAVSGHWELTPVDEFRRFVRPTWRPSLTQFCTELTAITQEQVDGADTFPGVLDEFCWTFVEKHELFTPRNKTVWVTDGPWDLRDFVAKQCFISNIPRPPWLGGSYIDIRSHATSYFARKAGEAQPSSASPSETIGGVEGVAVSAAPTVRAVADGSISTVLNALGLGPFEGRLHSGIDDVRNIARILQELVKEERGWSVTANAKIHGKERRWDWMGPKGKINWAHPPGL